MPKTLPPWLRLKCNEKIVRNPASLFSQCVAALINSSEISGYCELEHIQDLCIAGRVKSEPIKVIYHGDCTILGCFTSFTHGMYHDHTERLGHYKFWNTNTRSSRRCIVAALPHHPETTIQTDVSQPKRFKRIPETKRVSCRRKLF